MPVTTPKDPLSGRVGHLTREQQHALDKLRAELQQDGVFVFERHDDPTLLRFLRARKFDLPNAKAMIVSAEVWRKEFGVDDIVKNFDFKEREVVRKHYPRYHHKTDKDGRPVYIERLGQINIKAMYAVTTLDRMLQRLVWEYEKLLSVRFPACSAAAGRRVDTLCTIFDLDKISPMEFYKVQDYVSQASGISQDRYPELMGRFYFINAPFLFSAVWSVIKLWLDDATVAKISILGYDYKRELLTQIPPENLPEDLGGSCRCPGGCSTSDAGPWNEDFQGWHRS